MSGGVFAVDRGVFDHPILADEPFTEREAWMWLISEAAWKPKRVRTKHGMVHLERGQLAHSQRFLAEKWQWDRSRVRNFLTLLEGEKMLTAQLRPRSDPAIAQQKAQVTNILTICNYDKYQFGPPRDEPSSQHGNEQETIQNQPKEEEIITKKENSCAVAKATRPKRDYSKEFEEAWQEYPRRDGGNPKPPAAKRFLAEVKSGADPQVIVDGVKKFAIAERRNIGTPFIPQMVKWLRDQRWLDYGPDSTIVKFDVRKHLI